jgi:glutamate racemase
VLQPGPIGVFDSGYGGLTIFKEIVRALPEHDFIYLGDNARAPYGSRPFDVIYRYTLESVQHLFRHQCKLVILACNTASARALRTIQQHDLPAYGPHHRVLGIIRPTAERIGTFSRSRHIGILATAGTVISETYLIEIEKHYPDIKVSQEGCPIWVPLVELNEHNTPGADYFVQRHVESLLSKDPQIDNLLLACTHYPLLIDSIRKFVPEDIQIIAQGKFIAESLKQYLEDHPEMNDLCSKEGTRRFHTTGWTEKFERLSGLFLGENVKPESVEI